jgi:hypothetical protein
MDTQPRSLEVPATIARVTNMRRGQFLSNQMKPQALFYLLRAFPSCDVYIGMCRRSYDRSNRQRLQQALDASNRLALPILCSTPSSTACIRTVSSLYGAELRLELLGKSHTISETRSRAA